MKGPQTADRRRLTAGLILMCSLGQKSLRHYGDNAGLASNFSSVFRPKQSAMSFKFEKLEVWTLSLELSDMIYEIANKLPDVERFNLASQMIRAATSVSLNIAEGSTSMSDKEQAKFIGYAIRSLIEVVACLKLIERRRYISDTAQTDLLNKKINVLFKKLQAFKNYLSRN